MCAKAFDDYMDGGDHSALGGQDPFELVDGGRDGVRDALLKVSTNVKASPDKPVAYSALALGRLVGQADLTVAEREAVLVHMTVTRDAATVTFYKNGLSIATSSSGAAGSKKGKTPDKVEADKFEAKMGMSWRESTAGVFAMYTGKPLSATATDAWGYGDDPLESAEVKARIKAKGKIWRNYVDAKDAPGLVEFYLWAARALGQEGHHKFSSALFSFVHELSGYTIAQGRSDLFLAFVEEMMAVQPGRGLCTKEAGPVLDADILQRKVLGVRSSDELSEQKLARAGTKLEELEALLDNERLIRVKASSEQQGRVDTLKGLIKGLEAKVAALDTDKPAKKACWHCGSFDHQAWACPVKKAEKEAAEKDK